MKLTQQQHGVPRGWFCNHSSSGCSEKFWCKERQVRTCPAQPMSKKTTWQAKKNRCKHGTLAKFNASSHWWWWLVSMSSDDCGCHYGNEQRWAACTYQETFPQKGNLVFQLSVFRAKHFLLLDRSVYDPLGGFLFSRRFLNHGPTGFTDDPSTNLFPYLRWYHPSQAPKRH